MASVHSLSRRLFPIASYSLRVCAHTKQVQKMRPDDFLLFLAAGYKSLFKRLQQQTSCLDALLTSALTLTTLKYTCTGRYTPTSYIINLMKGLLPLALFVAAA